MASNPSAPLLSTRAHQLFPALVAILLLGIVTALADLLVSALGLQTTGVQFRFQILGLFLASIPQLSILLVVIAGLSTLAGHRVAVRTASIITLLLAVITLLVVLPFGLDFLETRRLIGDAQMRGFTMAGMKTAGFAAWFALVMLWVGVRGMQASVKPDEAEARARGEGLVVGQ